jgi:ribulose-5-phosphate 4-epimerase/fuculose-1-phosphate aldolase
MSEAILRREMVALGASLFARGFSVGGGGNMSVRLPDNTILATPTSSSLGRLEEARLAKVNLTGEQISGDRMSKEVPFHLALYQELPDCGAVAHLHSTYMTALSCCEGLNPDNVMQPFTPYYVMRVGKLPLIPYYKPGSVGIADELRKRAGKAKAFLLANHGPIATGPSLVEAVNNAEELEETAKLLFILRSAGSRIRHLTDREIAELHS